MSYHVIDPDALPPTPEHPSDRRDLADAAELATLAAAVYEIAPGEQLPTTYHYHDRREELFYVLAGTARVETPDREYQVPAGRVFVAHPDSPHRLFNPADATTTVRVLMVGSHPFDIGCPYEPAGDAAGSQDRSRSADGTGDEKQA